MKSLLLIVVFFAASPILSQEKKLKSLLGEDFRMVTSRTFIPYMETNPVCEIVPSISLKGDTSGLVYQNEYVLFRNNERLNQSQMNNSFSFVKNTFVSNEEYQQFQTWIRDSLAREFLYSELYEVSESIKWLRIPSKDLRTISLINSSENKSAIRRKYPMNKERKFSYDSPNYIPLLSQMYLPQANRFNRRYDFDERILSYRYYDSLQSSKSNSPYRLETSVPSISHECFWALNSRNINDELSVLGQKYDQFFPKQPLIGITGIKANSFCHWKEMILQKELDERNISYKVRVTLPLVNETTNQIQTLTIPEKNYTQQWKISVQDYQNFMDVVYDSLMLEVLYVELKDETKSIQFLDLKAPVFNEYDGEMQDIDESDIYFNRQVSSLTKNTKILRKYSEEIKDIEKRYADRLYYYRYDRMNISKMGIVGDSKWESPTSVNTKFILYELFPSEKDSLGRKIGMDKNLEQPNNLLQGNGVRAHVNYSQYIDRYEIYINPSVAIETQLPKEQIKGISYEQALAYYHWKFPIWKAKEGDDWQQFVYPTEEQFNKIQNGEQLIIPEHKLDFPSPTFRYVVTFVPN